VRDVGRWPLKARCGARLTVALARPPILLTLARCAMRCVLGIRDLLVILSMAIEKVAVIFFLLVGTARES
jgi:hypothetical protein